MKRWVSILSSAPTLKNTLCQETNTIEAGVSLPEHLHCIWTLPEGANDFSIRWNLIKSRVSKSVKFRFHRASLLNDSKQNHRETTIWQRRFWEHQIRDDEDYHNHFDYIYYNPVKHGKHVGKGYRDADEASKQRT